MEIKEATSWRPASFMETTSWRPAAFMEATVS
jgi:hypothetical protein